jgi:ribonucleotide reductase beta subunit family protein with ferritin-like domain
MSYMTDEEIYAIKEQVSAEILGLTPEEEIAYLKAKTDPILKQFGIRTVSAIKTDMPMKEKTASASFANP